MAMTTANPPLKTAAAIAGTARPSTARNVTAAAPVTRTTTETTMATIPTTLAKLRYDRSSAPSSPRMVTFSPARTPVVNR